VGATISGLQYLITKSMLQASNALNLSLYLLLKADIASKKNIDKDMAFAEEEDNGDSIRTHPVMDRLNQLSRLTDKLKEGVEEKIPGLQDQLNNLVKAAALMEGGHLSSDEDSKSNDEEGTLSSNLQEDDDSVDTSADQLTAPQRAIRSDDENNGIDSSESDDDRETQETIQRRIMTEAKFALRNQDIDHDATAFTNRKRRVTHASCDYGDETEEIDERTLAASRKLASTMNSIIQKSTASSEKRKTLVGAEEEGVDDEYDNLQRGLAMMEDDIGKGSDNDDEDDDMSENETNDDGFHSDEDEFYSLIKSKSRARKDTKKQMYTVAPKYPRLEGEVDGENDYHAIWYFFRLLSRLTQVILHL
jgi:U3 small nucleolar RNA-associated protein 3